MATEGVYFHPINKNKSRDERLIASVWDFGPTNPQSERKHTTDDSFAARMRPPLARALIELYGKEPILDPMCGSGTTCIEAALLGCKSYGVDIEQQNVEICEKQYPQILGANVLARTLDQDNRKVVSPIFMQGDARDLPFEDQSIGAVVFSPPYWNAIGKSQKVPDETGSPYVQSKGVPRTWVARNNPYGFTEGNIGNYRNYERYLTEMGHVFRELRRVVQVGGYIACVVKDLRRHSRRVPLGGDICRCGMNEGLGLFDWIINRMYHMVFWQIHHAYKTQHDEGLPMSLTAHEHILVFIREEE